MRTRSEAEVLEAIRTWDPATSPRAADGEEWLELDALLDELFREPPTAPLAAPVLLGLFERFPDHDGYGVMWTVLHGIESLEEYEAELVASLRRRSTPFGRLLVQRIANTGRTTVAGVDIMPLLSATLESPTLRAHRFLGSMVDDPYFPNALVARCRAVLVDLCGDIEAQRPAAEADLFALTHAAVERLNALEPAFEEQGSELETGAREAFATDFRAILDAYGFVDVELERAIANRDW
ncbi:MAG: DUF5713 family protein [Sandaracinaceae bacterium]